MNLDDFEEILGCSDQPTLSTMYGMLVAEMQVRGLNPTPPDELRLKNELS